MNKVYSTAAAALEGLLRNDMTIAAGGFGLCNWRCNGFLRSSNLKWNDLDHIWPRSGCQCRLY